MKELTNLADLKGQEVFINVPAHNLTMIKVKIKDFIGGYAHIEIAGNKRQCFLRLDEIKYFEVN